MNAIYHGWVYRQLKYLKGVDRPRPARWEAEARSVQHRRETGGAQFPCGVCA